ncbi:MAG: hypothetical protein NQU41_04560 [Candidatus Methanosuratincola sp.]|jgi:hypothetical protein|nr:hypothetical protein [Candidatus Methanosuratincola sp.]
MNPEMKEEITKKALSSVSTALAHAQTLLPLVVENGNPGSGAQGPGGAEDPALHASPGGGNAAATENGLRRAYASALRCRLEIQYALLLIQKGLSIGVEMVDSSAPSSRSAQKARLAAGLKSDLEGALSALESGSPEVAGAALAASDSKAAQLISKIRGELKRCTRVQRRDRDRRSVG